jgi:hypothetical protein
MSFSRHLVRNKRLQVRAHRGRDVREEPVVRVSRDHLHDGHSVKRFHLELLDDFERRTGNVFSYQDNFETTHSFFAQKVHGYFHPSDISKSNCVYVTL